MSAQSEYRSFLPQISIAKVINYDPDRHGVYIEFPSGQQLAESAKVLINGPADQSRIEQVPLPVIGTWGLVAFPQGDIESAVWLGSFYMSPINAVTTSNPSNPADSQTKYMSHASGAYQILDYAGNFTYWSPDGTLVNINVDNKEPITYQHGMDPETGGQTLVEVGHDYRRPFGSPPFYVSITQTNGNSIVMAPNGTVTITGGNPQQATVTITNQGIITLNTGNTGGQGQATAAHQIQLNPTGGEANPITITANAGDSNQTQILIDPDSNISMVSDRGDMSVNTHTSVSIVAGTTMTLVANAGNISILSTGDIILNTGTHSDSVDTIINTYNEHTHPDPQGGNTGIPNQQLP